MLSISPKPSVPTIPARHCIAIPCITRCPLPLIEPNRPLAMATAVLVPETEYDFEAHVAEKIRQARLMGKTNYMIVVAEGCVSAMKVGDQIREKLGLDPRVTILGHIQRGGSPTAKDRVIATRMGYEAVRVLAEGGTNRVIVTRSDQIVDMDIDEGLSMMKTLNQEEFQVMKIMTGQ